MVICSKICSHSFHLSMATSNIREAKELFMYLLRLVGIEGCAMASSLTDYWNITSNILFKAASCSYALLKFTLNVIALIP